MFYTLHHIPAQNVLTNTLIYHVLIFLQVCFNTLSTGYHCHSLCCILSTLHHGTRGPSLHSPKVPGLLPSVGIPYVRLWRSVYVSNHSKRYEKSAKVFIERRHSFHLQVYEWVQYKYCNFHKTNMRICMRYE